MTNRYLLSFDPGESMGIALGMFSDEAPYTLVDCWQPRGGVRGFLTWWRSSILYDTMGVWTKDDVIVSESFVLLSNTFVANVEPVRIEGAMLALGITPVFQRAYMKKLVPDSLLVEHDLWITPKAAREKFDHKDGRDAMDAIIHGLAYLKSTRHLPTLRHYWPETVE